MMTIRSVSIHSGVDIITSLWLIVLLLLLLDDDDDCMIYDDYNQEACRGMWHEAMLVSWRKWRDD